MAIVRTAREQHQTTSAKDAGTPAWALAVIWALLAVVAAVLLAVGASLLVRMQIFSTQPLSDEQVKAVWAFLGVALGTVVTLIGTLLADQNNRRADNRSREAENRLVLDTRAKVLELITDNGEYAQKGRVAGAVATLMELRGGPVAIRLLGDVWEGGNIGSTTAVWLISQILESKESSEDEKTQAATLLGVYATRLVPERNEPNQDWYEWPDIVDDGHWPTHLARRTRLSLIFAAEEALRAREPKYWFTFGTSFPLGALASAFDQDPEPDLSGRAAVTLAAVLELDGVNDLVPVDEATATKVRDRAAESARDWPEKLRTQVEAWASRTSWSTASAPGDAPPHTDDSV